MLCGGALPKGDSFSLADCHSVELERTVELAGAALQPAAQWSRLPGLQTARANAAAVYLSSRRAVWISGGRRVRVPS